MFTWETSEIEQFLTVWLKQKEGLEIGKGHINDKYLSPNHIFHSLSNFQEFCLKKNHSEKSELTVHNNDIILTGCLALPGSPISSVKI